MRKQEFIYPLIYGVLFCLIYLGISELTYNFAMDIGDKMYLLDRNDLPFFKVLTIPLSLLLVVVTGFKTYSHDRTESLSFKIVLIVTAIVLLLSYFSGRNFNILLWPTMDYEDDYLVFIRNETIMDMWEYFLILSTLVYLRLKAVKND